jgi:AcrR family transcriptional regulator
METESLPTLQPTDARERLMAAALAQFTLRGYAATSVRELCEAAGVTKPVLYYYFKSKEGLYLKLMEESYVRFEAILTDLTSFSGTVRERTIHFCAGLFASYVRQLPILKLCYSIYYGTPQGAPYFDLEQYYDRVLDVLTRFIEDGVAAGEINREHVTDGVWTVMGCLNMAIEEQLCHRNPRIDTEAMVRMIDLVFNGLTSNTTKR